MPGTLDFIEDQAAPASDGIDFRPEEAPKSPTSDGLDFREETPETAPQAPIAPPEAPTAPRPRIVPPGTQFKLSPYQQAAAEGRDIGQFGEGAISRAATGAGGEAIAQIGPAFRDAMTLPGRALNAIVREERAAGGQGIEQPAPLALGESEEEVKTRTQYPLGAPGEQLYVPQTANPSDVQRWAAQASTLDDFLALPLGTTRTGARVLLGAMVPGVVGQLKQIATGPGNAQDKLEQARDLVVPAVIGLMASKPKGVRFLDTTFAEETLPTGRRLAMPEGAPLPPQPPPVPPGPVPPREAFPPGPAPKYPPGQEWAFRSDVPPSPAPREAVPPREAFPPGPAPTEPVPPREAFPPGPAPTTPVPPRPPAPVAPAAPAKPEVAKLEPDVPGKMRNKLGDPLGTTYHATPEDWAAWQDLQKLPVKEKFQRSGEIEAIKNKYGGMPPQAPRTSGLPSWVAEEMQRRGLKTGRIFNDVDLSNPSIREAIQSDPTLTAAQKENLLATGSIEAAEIETGSPHDLVPALKPKEGDVIQGQKGNSHDDVYAAQGDIEGKMLRVEKPEHGFWNSKLKKFQSREEAAAYVGEKDPLHSERLIELQKATAQPEPPTQPAPAPGQPVPEAAAPVADPIGETVIEGKPLREWEKVTEASGLPKGEARARLARRIGVANQPAKILGRLKQPKKLREILAPPPTPESLQPVAPAVPPASPAETKPPVSETKPPAPATPAPVAKAQGEVSKVAATEGQRAAKDVKGELVTSIEAEIAKLPEQKGEAMFGKPASYNGVKKIDVRPKEGPWNGSLTIIQGKSGLWRVEVTDYLASGKNPRKLTQIIGSELPLGEAKQLAEEQMLSGNPWHAEKSITENGKDFAPNWSKFREQGMQVREVPPTVTIDIPGDGKFAIPKTRYALERMLARAKALETKVTQPKPFTEELPTKAEGAQFAKEAAQPPPSDLGPTGGAGPGSPSVSEFEERNFPGYQMVKAAFPDMPVRLVTLRFADAESKVFEVEMPNGSHILIDPVRKSITFDKERVAGEHGIRPDQIIGAHGKYRGREDIGLPTTGLIELARDFDAGTLSHEKFHAFFDLVFSDAEKSAILKRYGTEERAAEAWRRHEGYFRSLTDRLSGFGSKLKDLAIGNPFPSIGGEGPGSPSITQGPDPDTIGLSAGSPTLNRIQRAFSNFYQGIGQLFRRGPVKQDLMTLANRANNLPRIVGQKAGNSIRLRARTPQEQEALTFLMQSLKMSGDKLSVEAADRLGELEFEGDPGGYLRTKQADMETLAQRFLQQGKKLEAEAAIKAAKAMQYAQAHFNELRPVAEEFRRKTDLQHRRLAMGGVDVNYENWYVPQRHDLDLMSGGDRPIVLGHSQGSGVSTGFKKAKVYEDYASAIEAEFIPRTLNAADLLENYVAQTEKVLMQKSFYDSMRSISDPVDGKSLVIDVPRRVITRPDGSIDVQESVPIGYTLAPVTPGARVAVHNGYIRLIKALTGTSQLAESAVVGTLQDVAAIEKHIGLALDTFHASRTLQGELALTGKVSLGARQRMGRALVEYSPKDLDAAVSAGELTQEMADWIRTPKPMQVNGRTVELNPQQVVNIGINNGLNIARFADVIYRDWLRETPVLKQTTGAVNKWVFDKMSRSAIAHGFSVEFERIAAQRPELTANQVGKQVARDINVMFGNLQKESFFRNPSLNSIMQVLFLAPRWVESLARREVRGAVQLGEAGFNLARGRPANLGTVGKGIGTGLAAYFVGTQILNLITRHQLTFQNKEHGHKLDAWIPDLSGKTPGFFISPLSVFGEITHDILRFAESKPDFASALAQIGANKLGNLGRFLEVVASGRDPLSGDKIIGTGRRAAKAGLQLIPVPITLSQGARAAGHAVAPELIQAPPPGALQRQLTASAGFKTEPAGSAQTQVYRMADAWKSSGTPKMQAEVERRLKEDFGPSDYGPLRTALVREDLNEARRAYQQLRNQGKTPKTIRQTLQHPHPFTGSALEESKFKASLSPEDRETYRKAIEERKELYRRFQRMLNTPQQ